MIGSGAGFEFTDLTLNGHEIDRKKIPTVPNSDYANGWGG